MSDIVNRRPIGVQNFTQDDWQAITPNYLFRGRSRNKVTGVSFSEKDSLVKRQEVLREMEQQW